TLIGLYFAMIRRDVAYVAVLVWAFVGIAVKQSATPPVLYGAVSAAIVLAVAVGVGWWAGRQVRVAQ
ncbi:MAG: tryptophan-rich sensory protein, partial [Caldilinea sp.]